MGAVREIQFLRDVLGNQAEEQRDQRSIGTKDL